MRFTRIDLVCILVAVIIFAALGVVATVTAATPTPPTCTTHTLYWSNNGQVEQYTECVSSGQTPPKSGQQPASIIDASTVYLIEGGYCYDVLLSNNQQETWCYRSHGREHIKPVSGRMS